MQALRCIFLERENQHELESVKRKGVRSDLGKVGQHETNMKHTAIQAWEKLKKLKQDYKNIKDHNNQSGSNHRSSRWRDLLDAFMGHHLAFSATATTT